MVAREVARIAIMIARMAGLHEGEEGTGDVRC